jgi:hypothetical protein
MTKLVRGSKNESQIMLESLAKDMIDTHDSRSHHSLLGVFYLPHFRASWEFPL